MHTQEAQHVNKAAEVFMVYFFLYRMCLDMHLNIGQPNVGNIPYIVQIFCEELKKIELKFENVYLWLLYSHSVNMTATAVCSASVQITCI